MVYVVKQYVVMDDEGTEIEVIRYITTDSDKADEFVEIYGVKSFMWVDEYPMDEMIPEGYPNEM